MRKTVRIWAFGVVASVFAWGVQAQSNCWNFGTASPGSASPSVSATPNLTAGDVSQGSNYGTTLMLTNSSASSGYAGASGSYNAGAAARAGALSTESGGSAYFEFTLTPSTGYMLVMTNLSFGVRSTPTGPTAFCVRSGLDSYAADLATGTIGNTGAWTLKSVAMSASSTDAGAAVTFRIYGYGSTGSPSQNTANWRIDDLTVWAYAVTEAVTLPPGIAQVTEQSVRIGKTLTVPLTITPTDGDPVTYTNAMASAGVTGAWSLQNGLFTYAPADADLGSRSFTFDVADKDGTNSMTLAVSVLRRQTSAISMTAATNSYAQSFDALASDGTGNEWDNAAYPFAAWYAYTGTEVTGYSTGSGSGTSGGLYSWGTDSNRSLGSLASSGNTYRFGVAFTNETGQAITNLTVAFSAVQWRVGASPSTNTLAFEYCITNAVLPLTDGVWRPVRALCFDSPLVTNATQAAGSAHAVSAKSAVIGQPIGAGQVVLLRWSDPDDTGNDHGFGIDDVSVTWAAGTPADAIPVTGTGVRENFDEMGATATAALPWLWRVETRSDAPRVSGDYAAASNSTAWANSVSNFTYAGSYNFAATAAYDQAVGGLMSASAAQSVTVSAKFRNATGRPVKRWLVRYVVEKYRNGTVSTAVRLVASRDGAAWTEVGTPTAFAADADNVGYLPSARPGATVAAEQRAEFSAPVAEDGVFYLGWQIAAADGASSASAQALGIDDVEILPVYSPLGVILVK